MPPIARSIFESVTLTALVPCSINTFIVVSTVFSHLFQFSFDKVAGRTTLTRLQVALSLALNPEPAAFSKGSMTLWSLTLPME